VLHRNARAQSSKEFRFETPIRERESGRPVACLSVLRGLALRERKILRLMRKTNRLLEPEHDGRGASGEPPLGVHQLTPHEGLRYDKENTFNSRTLRFHSTRRNEARRRRRELPPIPCKVRCARCEQRRDDAPEREASLDSQGIRHLRPLR